MLLLLAAACRSGRSGDTAAVSDASLAVAGEPASLRYAPALGVDLAKMTRTPSGLYYRDEAVGTGTVATPGRTAAVHYTGWLANGKKFDSSRGGQPFSFGVGQGQVIAGWDEGVSGMKVGGRRKLVIPPAQGYGKAGAGGVIPPDATLVFDVELLDVR